MVDKTEAFHALTAARWRFAVILTICMLAIYLGFILLVAFDKPLLSTLLMPGLSLGILLGALVIIGAWVLTFIYVRRANTTYDAKIAELRR